MADSTQTIPSTEDLSLSTVLNATHPDCLVLPSDPDFLPWNNPHSLLSARTEELVRQFKDMLVLPLCFLIGCPANVINMAVFFRQGLKERINVCLFALALADGLYLFFNMLWYGEQLYLQFTTKEIYGPVMHWIANHYLLGFYSFTTVSQILSAIIASERCFCILQPLRSQSMLPTSSTTLIIVAIFLIVPGLYFLIVTRYYLVCAYDPSSDNVVLITLGAEFYHQHKEVIDVLDLFVYGTGLPWLVVTVVIVTTVVTVVKLRQVVAWRKSAATSGGGSVSAREIGLTRMLVGSSVFFIVCVFPFTVFRLVTLTVPEISPGQRHHNLFMTGLWLLNIFSYINSTFNFLIYYAMGSRYRDILHGLLTKKSRRTSTRKGGKEHLHGATATGGTTVSTAST